MLVAWCPGSSGEFPLEMIVLVQSEKHTQDKVAGVW